MAQGGVRLTQVQILSGSRNIGGTFIKVVDGDNVLVFDQGIRFDLFGRYFSQWIQPSGVMELRKLGVVPKEEWYQSVDELYITHLHLDHLGALSNIPSGIKLHIPGLSIYSEMKRRWENSPIWLNLIPENYYLQLEDVPPMVEDKNRVLAIPVSHSAYPSFAYLYFGNDKTILYTGDMRLHGFLEDKQFKSLHKGPSLMNYLETQHDLKIDVLLIEGTNFGSERSPILPDSAMALIEKIMTTSDLVMVTSHYLDAEFLTAVLDLAKKLEFRSYLSSEIVAKSLTTCGQKFDVKILEEFSKTPVFPTAPLTSILEGKSLLITSYYEIVDLCRRLEQKEFRNRRTVCILTEPEVTTEEMLEYSAMNRWLSLYGIQTYRIRVSGHYYPFELAEILDTVKFKELLPVHTEHPELMLKMIRSKG